jgi:hypothetical protein
MKTKSLLFSLLIVIVLFNDSFSQDKSKAFTVPKVVWFGVDFTAAKFTLVDDNPAIIVNQYLKTINTLILTQPEKFDIKKFFNKAEVFNNIDQAVEYNLKIDPSSLVITGNYSLDPDEVKNIIKKYNVKENSGTGLIFIAESLDKVAQTGSYYVCFFDIASKKIIDSRRMVGKASGFGFRNYWSGTIYNIMKMWALQ